MYRYYVSECLLPNGKRTNGGNLQGTRLPAERIEKFLVRAIGDILPEPETIFGVINKVVATPMKLEVTISVDQLTALGCHADLLLSRAQQQCTPEASLHGEQLVMTLAIPASRKGRTITTGTSKAGSEPACAGLAELVRVAHRKLTELDASPLDLGRHSEMRAPVDAWTRQRLPIGMLAPDIQKAMLQGTVPFAIDAEALLAMDLPLDWEEQRRVLGTAIK